MGGKQSSTSGQQNELSVEDMNRLLESQRKHYEEKCRQLLKQASEQKPAQEKVSPKTSPATGPTSQAANHTETGSTQQHVNMQQSASTSQPAILPQPMYPQLPQPFNQPNVMQLSPPQPGYSQPFVPQPGYPQQQFFPQNPNVPQFAQVPVFSQQAGPQPGGFAQPPVSAQQPPYQQQRCPAPQLPPLPPRPSQLVFPQPAQAIPQPAPNSCNATSPERNLTRPKPAVPSAPPAPRERSQSRPRRNTSPEHELDCATCRSPLGQNIFRCSRGHNSCDFCKRSGSRCFVCFQTILNVRNYDLELKAAQRKVACPNKSDGCIAFVKLSEMDNHTTMCPFQPQKCPLSSVFGNCDWTGQLNKMSSHFKSLHPSQRQTNVDTEMQLQHVCKNSRHLVLVVLGVYNFVLHVKVAEATRNIYMAVQLIGTQKTAEKWIYEIQVYNKNEAHRKYTFTDTCSSSSGSVDDVFNQRKCAVLPFAYATTFVYKSVLTYKVYIKKIEDPNEKPKRVRKRNKNCDNNNILNK